MSINIADLEPGDIVFPYSGVDLSVKGTPTGHVMIVGEADKAGIATQIHQVAKSMTNTLADTGTQRERLIPNSPKSDGVSGSRKRILRCRNTELARHAARLALYWQRWFQLGFSDVRRANATYYEDQYRKNAENEHGNNAARHVAGLRRHFFETGMFRAIKYAARREGFLSYPGESGESGQGMFCSMFVVVCYQVAGLRDVVKTADVSDRLLRVSDKKMEAKDLKEIKAWVEKNSAGKCNWVDWELYRRHTLALKERNHYELDSFEEAESRGGRRKKLVYQPSILYWDFKKAPSILGFDWAQAITKGMMVDAKIVMPRGLYDSLVDDKAGWRDMGDLVGPQHFEKPEDIQNRAKQLADEMAQRRKTWVKHGVHR
jgi:hypothetical protein